MKTVLFLLNGFGIESKGSYSVYNETLMPTFDNLTRKYMFSKLESNVRNINDAYRNMSLEIDSLYNYNIYSRETNNIAVNKTVLDIQKDLLERKSKLHIFCFIDTSFKILDNIKHFLKTINKEHDKQIYLHMVLTSNSYDDYDSIVEVMSKINMDTVDYAKIGMVLGLGNMLNTLSMTDLNFFLRNLVSEGGEKWSSFKQKLDVCYGMKTSPLMVNPFVVNNGFGIQENDLFLIWNYDNVDITNFINGVKEIEYKEKNNIKFYSLFPITYSEQIPYILNFEVAKKSLITNMKGLSFKTLVIAKSDDIRGINYYLNGMQMINNPDITYLRIEDVLYNGDLLVRIINKYPQDFIIVNYDITDVNTIEELEERLKNIDNVIGKVYENTSLNSYNIVISSLYGINKTLTKVSTGEICNIIYNRVPMVYVDKLISKKIYMIMDGKISDIFRLCYKSINSKYLGTTIVNKKNFLYRIIYK